MTAVLESIVGRYMSLDFEGRRYRVYFEEAGEGIPLICLHTAGADGRQYRGVLNDAEVTKRFRVIAFDMPWHGKSSPPVGFEREEYRLTRDFYTAFVMAFADALSLQRPVVMGCFDWRPGSCSILPPRMPIVSARWSVCRPRPMSRPTTTPNGCIMRTFTG